METTANKSIKIHEVRQLPIAVVDNFYSEKDCELIWQELCFLSNAEGKLKGPDTTGSAYTVSTDGNKTYLKSNLGVFLDDVYANKYRHMSNILTANRQVFLLSGELQKLHYVFKFLADSNQDHTLIQYYENSHYYKPHVDSATLTAISWFFKQPKKFTGGDLIFDGSLNIECSYNKLIIFPSIILHEVTETNMPDELVGQNLGRYSVTQLISTGLTPHGN